jgi:V/A-type H+-transporting ATPase subunit E
LGLEELIHTLRKNEQKQKDDIWQAVKTEADAIRKQVAEAIADITEKQAEQLASACQKSMRSIYADAEIKTREKKLFAFQALDQALKKAAAKNLPALRQNNYKNVFAFLVAELPEREWEKIVVNYADLEVAAKFFAADIIQPDAAISGGLIAATADDTIIVDNSFEKRLERKWPLILPAMIAACEKRYGKSGSAENT